MANQPKKTALYYVNTEIVASLKDGSGVVTVRQQYGISLNEESNPELELAYLIDQGLVDPDTIVVNVTGVNKASGNNTTGVSSGKTRAEMLAAMGHKPAANQEAAPAVAGNDIPF